MAMDEVLWSGEILGEPWRLVRPGLAVADDWWQTQHPWSESDEWHAGEPGQHVAAELARRLAAAEAAQREAERERDELRGVLKKVAARAVLVAERCQEVTSGNFPHAIAGIRWQLSLIRKWASNEQPATQATDAGDVQEGRNE